MDLVEYNDLINESCQGQDIFTEFSMLIALS